MKKGFWTVRNLAGTAMMGAMSIILYLFVKIKLPFFPSFLDLQISEIPALIAGFSFGPISGAIVIILRFVGKAIFMGSSTAYVGELADLIIGLALVIPCSLIYKKHRSFKGALISFGIGVAISTAVALAANAFILIPFYIKLFFHGDENILISILSQTIKGVDANNYLTYYTFYACLPFNLLRYVIVGIFTFILYKRIKWVFDKIKN